MPDQSAFTEGIQQVTNLPAEIEHAAEHLADEAAKHELRSAVEKVAQLAREHGLPNLAKEIEGLL